VGWAAGIERLGMLGTVPVADTPLVSVIPWVPDAENVATQLASKLRIAGIAAHCAYKGNEKRRFELASKSGALVRLVVAGEDNPAAIPSRRGIPVRINEIGSTARAGNDIAEKILRALEQSFNVVRLVENDGSFSPDALLRPLLSAR
jgi:histidyl-tRNA synthetase